MKALRSNLPASVAVVAVVVMASAIGGYILANQRLNWPAWVPVVGESNFILKAELETAQGILPGQGQAVNVSGVQVGDIASVDLVDGKAVATMRIEERYARVYPDATVLLRPKTALKDMVIELDPGRPAAGEELEDGAVIGSASTLSDVNFSEFLESLDADTQSYLQLLVGDAGAALGDGGGEQFADTLRVFPPLARDAAKASKLVAQRRKRLRRVMSNFSTLVSTLGEHETQLSRFVSGSSEVFRRFSNQNANFAETIELLPAALRSGNRALASLDRLGRTMGPTLAQLQPTAKGLAPLQRSLRPFFRETTPAVRDQLRPFTRAARPTARELVPASRDLADSMPGLSRTFGALNALFNTLAYDPPGEGKGREGYLFYVPWASHNTNSTLAGQDGIGPVQRGVVLMSCGALQLLESQKAGGRNPLLGVLIQLINAPLLDQVCPGVGG